MTRTIQRECTTDKVLYFLPWKRTYAENWFNQNSTTNQAQSTSQITPTRRKRKIHQVARASSFLQHPVPRVNTRNQKTWQSPAVRTKGAKTRTTICAHPHRGWFDVITSDRAHKVVRLCACSRAPHSSQSYTPHTPASPSAYKYYAKGYFQQKWWRGGGRTVDERDVGRMTKFFYTRGLKTRGGLLSSFCWCTWRFESVERTGERTTKAFRCVRKSFHCGYFYIPSLADFDCGKNESRSYSAKGEQKRRTVLLYKG